MQSPENASPPSVDRGDPAWQVAIIGLAGRFPGAADVAEFWDNVAQARSALGTSDTQATDYHSTCFRLEDKFCFDAGFFGLSAAEAARTDPQHRLFLETAWQAMEDAGYGARTVAQEDAAPTGVFAACGFNDYVTHHVGPSHFRDSAAETFSMLIGNDKDFIASRVAHHLGLQGPAQVVQSACSSGLLAVHAAVQSLLQGEVDMALAGASSISVSLEDGYAPDRGGPMSARGQITPFDATADGIIGGNGAAALVLKRRADAESDGDHIYAIIHGSAANNDGAQRASFTAPSVQGQIRVLRDALSLSGLTPEDVTYIEAHGTGTPLGDPIEIQALQTVYGAGRTPCAVGSAKSAVGHLNAAAGLAGLVKAVGVLHRGMTPPVIGFRQANPMLNLAGSRFYIAGDTNAPADAPHAAVAVSSFGFGGTNVHMILGRAPEVLPTARRGKGCAFLPLSAKTNSALEEREKALANWLRHAPDETALDDVSATLRAGRAEMPRRSLLIAHTLSDARVRAAATRFLRQSAEVSDGAVLVFPGQGQQFPGMGQALYAAQPGYARAFDQCIALAAEFGLTDLDREIHHGDAARLRQTRLTQPALFATSYATARWLLDCGLTIRGVLGHSIGEYVAATLAGVFTLADAMRLVVHRAALIDSLPQGAMASVTVPPEALQDVLGAEVALAALNRSGHSVIAGTDPAIDATLAHLQARGISGRRLDVSHGFHSHLLDPVLEPFRALFDDITLSPPNPDIALYSNLTGRRAEACQVDQAEYWVRHLRHTVRFANNMQQARSDFPTARHVLAGPGTMGGCLPVMASAPSQQDDWQTALGQLWVDGQDVSAAFPGAARPFRRVSLPTYPFARTKYVLPRLEPTQAGVDTRPAASAQRSDGPCRAYRAHWLRASPLEQKAAPADRLIWVAPGTEPPAAQPEGMQLITDLSDLEGLASSLDQPPQTTTTDLVLSHVTEADTLRILQALLPAGRLRRVLLLTRNRASVIAQEARDPEQALQVALLRSLPFEYPDVRAATLDVEDCPTPEALCDMLPLLVPTRTRHVPDYALRNGVLWRRRLLAHPLTSAMAADICRPDASYLILGGTGTLGRQLANQICATGARAILMARSIDDRALDAPGTVENLRPILDQPGELWLHRGSGADPDALRALRDRLEADGATLAGIFNLASHYGKATLADRDPERPGPNHQAKVAATHALEAVFGPLRPEFLLTFSSIAAEISGFGNSDYMSGCHFADHHSETATVIPAMSLAWDHWASGDDAAPGHKPPDQIPPALISSVEGFRSMWGALLRWRQGDVAHLVLTPAEIVDRYRDAARAAPEAHATSLQPDHAAAAVAPIDADQPPLLQLAVWLFGETLGHGDIRPDADFFVLGGDSIAAVRLLSRCRKITRCDLELAEVMANRTPLGLAACLARHAGTEALAKAWMHLQTLSAEDRRTLEARLLQHSPASRQKEPAE